MYNPKAYPGDPANPGTPANDYLTEPVEDQDTQPHGKSTGALVLIPETAEEAHTDPGESSQLQPWDRLQNEHEHAVPEMAHHEYATLFPSMGDDEFENLKNDIKVNGLLNPIITLEGKILDGIHRHRACTDVGIEPVYTPLGEEVDPLTYVIAMNLHWRHLTSSQRAAIGAEILEHEKARARQRQVTSTGGPNPQLREEIPQAEKGRARDTAATKVKTNPKYIDDAAKIKEQNPAAFQEIKDGRKSINQVKREMGLNSKVSTSTSPAVSGHHLPAGGPFNTILIDPIWRPADGIAEGDNSVSDKDLAKLPLPQLAQPGTHVYLWTSAQYLPEALAVLKRWGLQYAGLITWAKKTSDNTHAAEYLLLGIQGEFPPNEQLPGVCHVIEPVASEHRPDYFIELIEGRSPEPRLQVYAKQARSGWELWQTPREPKSTK